MAGDDSHLLVAVHFLHGLASVQLYNGRLVTLGAVAYVADPGGFCCGYFGAINWCEHLSATPHYLEVILLGGSDEVPIWCCSFCVVVVVAQLGASVRYLHMLGHCVELLMVLEGCARSGLLEVLHKVVNVEGPPVIMVEGGGMLLLRSSLGGSSS